MKKKLSTILDETRISVGLRKNPLMTRDGSKMFVRALAGKVIDMLDDTTDEELEAMVLPTLQVLAGLTEICQIGEKQMERRAKAASK